MVILTVLVLITTIAALSINSKINTLVGDDVEAEDDAPEQQPAAQPADDRTEVSVDDDAIKGDEDAPVTIIEFSDFECPYCGAFYGSHEGLISQFKQRDPSWEPAYPKIIEEYVETGKVRYVMRDLPLNFHRYAQKASEAAECAGEQDKFWEMHDILFENQEALEVNNLKAYAEEIGLDTDEFNTCLDSGRMASEVRSDMMAGQRAGVRGTPTFFVNGITLRGAQSFQAFKEVIDRELAAA